MFANLIKMYEGNIINIKELNNYSIISGKFYTSLRPFYCMKYIWEILITKFIYLRNEFLVFM